MPTRRKRMYSVRIAAGLAALFRGRPFMTPRHAIARIVGRQALRDVQHAHGRATRRRDVDELFDPSIVERYDI